MENKKRLFTAYEDKELKDRLEYLKKRRSEIQIEHENLTSENFGISKEITEIVEALKIRNS